MLLCIHFSEQLKLVSLDIDKKSFEFEPKDLVIPDSFVPVYIDGYISKQHKVNPFLINLFFKDSSSNKWYCYFFIFTNDKLVNLETPLTAYGYEKITAGSGTYYKVRKNDGLLIDNELLPEDIFKNNLITEDGSVIEEIDMKSIQIKLKSELESGSIVTYTSKYKGTFSERNCCFCDCCIRKGYTKGPYRYKLMSDNPTVSEAPKKKRWYSLGHFCNKKAAEKSSNEENCVKEEPEQDNVVTGKRMQDLVAAENSVGNIDINDYSVKAE
ncbi:hypothetical protein BdWA1_002909 [Babesia duncani]|uniref:Uncharacterized protein n=1 Tax=Babesia duncani TaxID=323732 RepID=A0AAD9PGU7_9APIC|nr:hypothetical protein BdWA1_003934 [Babesia duncani]KAK2195236.1 hypothetical protein BdWA1_002909 [Babesia duncani]